jgi:SPP1 gp7 family putative phage head morphogenesis protein
VTTTSLILQELLQKTTNRLLLKDISDASMGDLMDFFGLDDMEDMSDSQVSDLYGVMDSVNKISQDVTYSVQNMDEMESAVASGQDYMVWHTAEDEKVCGYCGPLDNKIVRADELDSLDVVPPAHVNCRCELVTIEDHYGELKPVKYYHSIPVSYDGFRNSGDEQIKTSMVNVDTPEEQS